MKNILAENMLRFGPKNLSESEKRNLQRLMEQVTGLAQGDATPFTGLKFSMSSGDNPGNMKTTTYTTNLTFTGGDPVIEDVYLLGPKGKTDPKKDRVTIKIKNAAFSCTFVIYASYISVINFVVLDAKQSVTFSGLSTGSNNFETADYGSAGGPTYVSRYVAYLVDAMSNQKYNKANDVFANVAWVKTARAAIPAAAAPTTTAPATTTPTKP
jgi:hypothetical protein